MSQEEEIGANYRIERSGNTVILYFKRPRWIIINLCIYGLGSLAFAFLPFLEDQEFKNYFQLSSLIFIFLSLRMLYLFIKTLCIPVNAIITIHKDSGILKAKLTYLKALILPFNEIKSLLLQDIITTEDFNDTLHESIRTDLFIVHGNGQSQVIHSFKSGNTFAYISSTEKQNLFKISGTITDTLARECGVSFKRLAVKKERK